MAIQLIVMIVYMINQKKFLKMVIFYSFLQILNAFALLVYINHAD